MKARYDPQGLWAVRIGSVDFMLKGPRWLALYSERYRKGVIVIPLGRGWRINIKSYRPSPLDAPSPSPSQGNRS